jgi:hypothetical protein
MAVKMTGPAAVLQARRRRASHPHGQTLLAVIDQRWATAGPSATLG